MVENPARPAAAGAALREVLVALWDGQPARGRGGIGEIVGHARQLRKPVVLVDANTFAVKRENFDRFA